MFYPYRQNTTQSLQIEDAKKSLVLYGNKTSQVMKDVLTDLHKIKRVSKQEHIMALCTQWDFCLTLYGGFCVSAWPPWHGPLNCSHPVTPPPPLQTESIKYTRRNENVKPFEPGGESSLEFYCRKSQCGLFALGTHSKKR